MSTAKGFDSWAIVELMGHVKMAGRVTEEERFGVKMGRIDIPQADGGFVTQYFGGSSVYRITPCTEDTARRAATLGVPAPVYAWQLPAPQGPSDREVERELAGAEVDIEDFDDEEDLEAIPR